MLSLSNGLAIAIISSNKAKIYYKDARRDDIPELDTNFENKLAIFKKYLSQFEKLTKTDTNYLIDEYTNKKQDLDNAKLNKYYIKGIDYVNKSLKKHLVFENDNIKLFPIIEGQRTYRMLIAGLSGSGKSHFASEFLKRNKPRDGGIFLFSPVDNDDSIKVKNIIHIKLENYEKEFDKPFEIEDIPEGSVCLFDDCDSYNKQYRSLYMETRNILLERGRHRGISTIVVQHQAQAGMRNRNDIVLRECEFYVLFPKYNYRDSYNLLKNYTSISKQDMNDILNIDNSRWVFIKKSVPSYYVSEHDICLL